MIPLYLHHHLWGFGRWLRSLEFTPESMANPPHLANGLHQIHPPQELPEPARQGPHAAIWVFGGLGIDHGKPWEMINDGIFLWEYNDI